MMPLSQKEDLHLLGKESKIFSIVFRLYETGLFVDNLIYTYVFTGTF